MKSKIEKIVLVILLIFLLLGIIMMLLPTSTIIRLILIVINLILFMSCLYVYKENTRRGLLITFCVICLVAIIVCSAILYRKYYSNNREIIEVCNSNYHNVLSVISNDKESLRFYVNNYYSPSDGFYINEVTFTPEDCLQIAEEIVPRDGFALSFEYPNGAIITFSNSCDGRFRDVILDNSNSRGFIVANLGYYKNYTHFDRYFIYGALNDLPTFKESQEHINTHSNHYDMLYYAVNNAEVYTDQHTLEEEYYSTNYISSDHQFGTLLNLLCENRNCEIYIDNSIHYYTDRYSLPFVVHDWFSVNDISQNMNVYMERHNDGHIPDSLIEYLVMDASDVCEYTDHIKESGYFWMIGIEIITEILLIYGLFRDFRKKE